MIHLTKADNGKTIDLSGYRFSGSKSEPCLVIEPGTEAITVLNATPGRSHSVRIHGEGHKIIGGHFDNHMDGIYVESDCYGIEIASNAIKAGGVGIYLDAGSYGTHIHHNVIHDCGRWFYTPKVPFPLPRFGWDKREGIAIDGSAGNLVEQNTLRRNAFAGITLYRNCGEFGSATRPQGANRNIVRENDIQGSRVKVWNAARQWRDLVTWECSCKGRWIPLWKVPKQPYQQWFNPSCLTEPLFSPTPFRFPFRWRIWQVSDEARDNQINDHEVSETAFILDNETYLTMPFTRSS